VGQRIHEASEQENMEGLTGLDVVERYVLHAVIIRHN